MGGRNNPADWPARIEPVVRGAGLELVLVECVGDTLRVYIDRTASGEAEAANGASGIGLEDCERVSRNLRLAFADLGEWTLEVSSPGLDRPLVRHEDFVRFCGSRIRVRARQPVAGSRQFTGRLQRADASGIGIEVEGSGEVAVAWDNVAQARLAPLWPVTVQPQRRARQ